MEIVKNQVEGLLHQIIVKVDYANIEEQVDKNIVKYSKEANIKGFRKGFAPLGMIKKLYRDSIVLEELDKYVSQQLTQYIKDNEIKYIFEPLLSINQRQFDVKTATEYELSFDICLHPDFAIDFSKEDKFVDYSMKFSDEYINDFVKRIQTENGKFEDQEISNIDSIIEVTLAELDENNAEFNAGIVLDDVKISVKMIKDEEIKNMFIGVGANTIIDFEIKKAFTNETDLAWMLKIKKEDINNIKPIFRAVVTNVKELKPSELNEELYKKFIGTEETVTEEDFYAKINEVISMQYVSLLYNNKLSRLKQQVNDKYKIEFPLSFIQRWLNYTQQHEMLEYLKQDEDQFVSFLNWDIISGLYKKQYDINLSEEDLNLEFDNIFKLQLLQYGITTSKPEMLEAMKASLTDKDKQGIQVQALERKIVDSMLEKMQIVTILVDEKEVSNVLYNKNDELDDDIEQSAN